MNNLQSENKYCFGWLVDCGFDIAHLLDGLAGMVVRLCARERPVVSL